MADTIAITKRARHGRVFACLFENVALGSAGGGSANTAVEGEAVPTAGGMVSIVLVRKSSWGTPPTAGGGFYTQWNRGGYFGKADYWDTCFNYAGKSDSNYSSSFPLLNPGLATICNIPGGWPDDGGPGVVNQDYSMRWIWNSPSDGVGEAVYDIVVRVTGMGG